MNYERKRVKRLLARNTLLFFVAFAALFSLFGVLVYQLVGANVYRLADEGLSRVGALSLDQEAFGYLGPAESTAADPSQEASEAEERSDTVSATNSVPLGDETGAFEEVGSVAAQTTLSSAFVAEVSQTYVLQNPQLIYLLRDASGNTLETQGLYTVYPDYFERVPFDQSNLGQVYGIDVQGQRYRGVNYLLDDTEGDVYLQALVDVEAEAALLDHFTRVLIIYLVVAVVAAAAVSYLLSRRTIKPIVASLEQQTEFVQNASHELRTPLAVVRALQERLLADPSSRIVDRFEDINAAVDETKRLSRLVDDLMMLTLVDGSEVDKSESVQVDVSEVVARVSELYADIAEAGGRSFTTDGFSTGQAYIDDDVLRQVLGVLLDNALKYTDEGDSITVRSENRGSRIALMVEDTGRGIAPEDCGQIFDRFYRSADARTMPGNGLGLPIARALLERAGGSIEVEANQPRGSVFTILLPRA